MSICDKTLTKLNRKMVVLHLIHVIFLLPISLWWLRWFYSLKTLSRAIGLTATGNPRVNEVSGSNPALAGLTVALSRGTFQLRPDVNFVSLLSYILKMSKNLKSRETVVIEYLCMGEELAAMMTYTCAQMNKLFGVNMNLCRIRTSFDYPQNSDRNNCNIDFSS